MKFSKKYLAVIGILLFVFVIYRVGLEKILSTILNVNLYYIFISLPILLPILYLKAYKWKIIVKEFGIQLSQKDAMQYWLIGLFVATLTPGRIGDFYRALYIRTDKFSSGKALATIAIDRVFDLVALMLLSIIGVVVILTQFGDSKLSEYALVLVLVGSIALATILHRASMEKLARPLFNMLVPEKYKAKLKGSFNEFYDSIKFLKNKKRTLAIAFVVSLVAWLIGYLQAYFFFLSLGYVVPYFYLIIFLPIEVLFNLIPITVSGFGTREIALVALFGLLNVPPEVAVSFGLIGFVFGTIILSFLGLLLWVRRPAKLRLLETQASSE